MRTHAHTLHCFTLTWIFRMRTLTHTHSYCTHEHAEQLRGHTPYDAIIIIITAIERASMQRQSAY